MAKLWIDEKAIIKEVKGKKVKKVLVQAPAGLKRLAVKLAHKLEKEAKARVFISADSCFGACDLPIKAMKIVKPDLVLHIGHNKMLNMKKVVYFPSKYTFSKDEQKELAKMLIGELKNKGIKRIIGVAAIQYLELLKELVKEAKKEGITIELKKSAFGIEGQVLGCETQATKNKSKAVFFVGDGVFHALGILRSEKKPVLALNPLSKSLLWLDEKELRRFLKKRYAVIAKAMQAKRFGILLSTKPGQFNEEKAIKAKKLLEKKGREATIIAVDNISESVLLDFELDAFVFIACPRLVDDSQHWKKPLISFEELLVMLGKRKTL
ncbi:MAG: diphthamide biosynthesis enzyme Dph2 [Candidatus Diapherotrites archaeon]|nr:diphthamide biosynthesis enzyme Dph2 [Candidatus Diapherotrites archaeon]